MTFKVILKMSVMAVITAGIVLWRGHEDRRFRVLRNEDQDPLNDLGNELCLPNIDCGDVVDPREYLLCFPELRSEGLHKNLMLPKLESWKSNCPEWRDFQRLRTAGSLGAGSYGHVAMAFDDNEREVALK